MDGLCFLPEEPQDERECEKSKQLTLKPSVRCATGHILLQTLMELLNGCNDKIYFPITRRKVKGLKTWCQLRMLIVI